jgi:hypothetical protein
MNKLSPDERITQIALEQNDPFARPGQLSQSLPKTPFQQRDFSHLDDPADVVKKSQKAEVKEKKKPKVKAKALENVPEPVAEPVQELRPNDIPPCPAPNPADLVTESRNSEGMPSYRAEFSGRDIMVAYPCYKTTNPVTAFAMIAMALDFGRDKIRFDMSIGDAMVYHSRNKLAEKFLQTDAKYLLMMDDDIIPCIGRPAWMRATVHSAQNVADLPLQRHIIHRLLNSNKTLIGGAYFGRQEGARLMCSDQGLVSAARDYHDIIAPVDWIGTGCLLIHRSVFEDIQKTFPELKTDNPENPFDYFLPMQGHVGEDISFCYRAKKAGHQPHIDLGTPVFHVGYKTY